jgi:hypothetical protein
MNCDEFEQRMQRLIDDRGAVSKDAQLTAHARCCDDCGDRMHWWQQIESVVAPAVPSPDAGVTASGLTSSAATSAGAKQVFAWSTLAAVAAGLLVACLLVYSRRDAKLTPVATNLPAPAEQPTDVDPARWWRDVQDRDWIGQTMPAVQSVRAGVAPLGRSIRHAVAILTTGGGEQTS